ncbi:MAG: hypothetical protein E7211_06110 [Clostridium lundense]|nr:hypothetical protein [Clostridium lundense]
MGNAFEMIAVGNNCPGYTPMYDGFQALSAESQTKSCRTCSHFEKGICNIDYYDKVVSSLDQA